MCFVRNLLKALIAALKDKKAPTTIQRKIETKTKKEHKRLEIVSSGVDAVAKTDDEIYVLSIIKINSFHLFSMLCQRSCCRVIENVESDVATLKILTTMQKL